MELNAATLTVPTDLVWGLANSNQDKKWSKEKWQQKGYPVTVVQNVLYTMYPGIELAEVTSDPVKSFIQNKVSDDLNAQFEGRLQSFPDENVAIQNLGPELTLKQVKPCQGAEWKDWVKPTAQP